MLPKFITILLAIASFAAILMSGCSNTDTEGKSGSKRGGGIDMPRFEVNEQKNIVAIQYNILLNESVRPNEQVYDIEKILEDAIKNNKEPEWGPELALHYSTEPLVGYYRSDDAEVIRTHMKQLYDAGVDAIILDNSNYTSTWPDHKKRNDSRTPTQVILDTLLEMRSEGKPTPYVFIHTATWQSDPGHVNNVQDVYDWFYKDSKYDNLFVYYDGKPLMAVTDVVSPAMEENFTIRKMWAYQAKLEKNEWSHQSPTPQLVAMKDGKPEAMSVTPSWQTFMFTHPDSVPRHGGRTYAEQWKRAFEVKPRIIIHNFWNAWAHYRFDDPNGIVQFNDGYIYEFSRDVEPVKGSKGDLYYRWMKEYIKAYKEDKPFPDYLIEAPFIIGDHLAILGDFEYGLDAWTKGDKTKAVSLKKTGAGTPKRNGNFVLAVQMENTKGSNTRFAGLNLKETLNLAAYDKITFSICGDGSASGKDITVELRLTDKKGKKWNSETKITLDKKWEDIAVDIIGYAGRNEIKSVEIGVKAGDTNKWEGEFFLDDVKATGAEKIARISSHRQDETIVLDSEPLQLNISAYLDDRYLTPKNVTAPKEGTTNEGYDSAVINVSEDGLVTPVGKGQTTISIKNQGKSTKINVSVIDNRTRILGSFEVDTDGWKPGQNVTEINTRLPGMRFDKEPTAAAKGNMFVQANMKTVAGRMPRSIVKEFDVPVDLSEYDFIRYAFNGDPGAPGVNAFQPDQTGYRTFITLTSLNGQELTKEFIYEHHDFSRIWPYSREWRDMALDVRDWTHRNAVKRIEIGYKAEGSTGQFPGSFYVDNIRAVSIEKIAPVYQSEVLEQGQAVKTVINAFLSDNSVVRMTRKDYDIVFNSTDSNIALIDDVGILKALKAGNATIDIISKRHKTWINVIVKGKMRETEKYLRLGGFDKGEDDWKKGENVEFVESTISGVGIAVPKSYIGMRLLKVYTKPYATGEALKTISKDFIEPVDLSEYTHLRYAFNTWPISSSRAQRFWTILKLTSKSGEVYEVKSSFTPAQWNDIAADISNWEGRSAITRIEIGCIIEGFDQPWGGKIFVDFIRAVGMIPDN